MSLSRTLLIATSILFLVSCNQKSNLARQSDNGSDLLTRVLDLKNDVELSIPDLLEEEKIVLLNFWGVMCIPCIEEIGELNSLYEESLKGSRVKFIAVNTDGFNNERLKIEVARRKIDIRFTYIADPDMEITDRYTNGFVPYNVLLTSKGGVVFESAGYNDKIFSNLSAKLYELAETKCVYKER